MAGPSIAVRVLGDLTGLGKSLGEAGSKASSAAGQAKAAFSTFLGSVNATGVLGPLGGMLDQISQGIDRIATHGKSVGPAMVGAGAAVAGLGVGLSAFGSKQQAAQQQLRQAIENTGNAYDDYGKSIQGAIKHGESYGHTSDETQNALQRLTEATHDPQKALDLLSTAEDVAAARHIDLATAATNVGKVYNGNTKLLKQFGIQIDATTGLTKDGKTATQALADVTRGQASAAQDTFAGKLDAVKAKVTDAVATFGQKYGPAIQGAGFAMAGLGTALSTGRAAFEALKNSQLVQSAVTKTATIIQWAFNAAMDANPIVLIVIGIGLLVAGFVLLYTKVGWFRDLINATWQWIVDHWPLLLAILLGPIGIAVDLIMRYWDQIKQGAAAVIDFVKWVFNLLVDFFRELPGRVAGFFEAIWGHIKDGFNAAKDWVVDRFNDLINFFKGLPGLIRDALADLGNIIKAPFQWAWDEIKKIFDFIKNAAHEVLSLPGKALESIPGVGGIISHIPGLQHGGIVTVPTLAVLGEGGPEAVIPLNRMGPGGPAVVVQNATFGDQVDVDVFMQRVAWHMQRQRV